MSRFETSFIDLCLKGLADLSEIDDYVDKWHHCEDDIEVHDFLGMSEDEYALWVEKPQSLRFILFSRKYNIPLSKAVKQLTELPFAARGANTSEIDEVMAWLKKTSRI